MTGDRIRSGRATRPEIIRAACDPFNGMAENSAELRSCPPDWRVIAGGRPMTAVRLHRREIERRRRNIEIVRRLYSADAAVRLERQLVEDVRAVAGDRATMLLRRGEF